MYRLPRCSLLALDAYGTIYSPREPLDVQYNRIAANRNGEEMSATEFNGRFKQSFKKVWAEFPNYGKSQHLSIQTFWHKVLCDLYHGDQPFIDDIIRHFGTRRAFRVFDDVEPFLGQLKRAGVRPLVASNADKRVFNLLANEFALDRFVSNEDIFLSYDLEVSKPDIKFFQLMLQKVQRRGAINPQEAWHVGDDLKNDIESALKAGWGAILVDRDRTSGFLRNMETARQLGEKFYVVSSLLAIEQVLSFTTASTHSNQSEQPARWQ
ncbi:hypothetical protein OGAPHI_005215 [Ogataea philodendri]|uniref:HAD family hydrolase n=1 Tax=Ogataea philodendri TaxID=1378263 RepID=A0A9P8P238_9ASCO|nr:uncharacterized protein OGAPHI_005215 [Ogataea philodendri]KAH3663812.1 hypothetical protein OGAPHI_005215 [Ogataea philodendri]